MVPYKLSGHSYKKRMRSVFTKKTDSPENISVISTAGINILLFYLFNRRGQPRWYIFGVLRNDILRG